MRPAAAPDVVARDAKPNERRQSFALLEIGGSGGRKRRAFERKHALVAFFSRTRIERDGEVPVTENTAAVGTFFIVLAFGKLGLVVARIASKPPSASIVGDED